MNGMPACVGPDETEYEQQCCFTLYGNFRKIATRVWPHIVQEIIKLVFLQVGVQWDGTSVCFYRQFFYVWCWHEAQCYVNMCHLQSYQTPFVRDVHLCVELEGSVTCGQLHQSFLKRFALDPLRIWQIIGKFKDHVHFCDYNRRWQTTIGIFAMINCEFKRQ